MDHDRAGDLIPVDVARDKHSRAGLGTTAHAQAAIAMQSQTNKEAVAVLWVEQSSPSFVPGFSSSASGYMWGGGIPCDDGLQQHRVACARRISSRSTPDEKRYKHEARTRGLIDKDEVATHGAAKVLLRRADDHLLPVHSFHFEVPICCRGFSLPLVSLAFLSWGMRLECNKNFSCTRDKRKGALLCTRD